MKLISNNKPTLKKQEVDMKQDYKLTFKPTYEQCVKRARILYTYTRTKQPNKSFYEILEKVMKRYGVKNKHTKLLNWNNVM